MNEQRRKRSRTVRVCTRLALGAGSRSHRARVALLGVALGVTATVSAAPAARTEANPGTAKPVAARHHWYEIGKATWYGGDFNGRKTANGETFDENELTCAHRTLPLGSWIRVTNLQNNRTTVVRVTDRGPWANHAVLDLSLAAARKLGFSGSANVRIDRVSPGETTAREIAQLDLPQKPNVQAGQ